MPSECQSGENPKDWEPTFDATRQAMERNGLTVEREVVTLGTLLNSARRYCFDIDGTICTQQQPGEYHTARPFAARIAELRRLKGLGAVILFQTARSPEFFKLTLRQLQDWGVPFDGVYFTKPRA